MLRLTELALENGWPIEDISCALQAIVGASAPPVDPPASASTSGAGSRIMRDEFSRLAFTKR